MAAFAFAFAFAFAVSGCYRVRPSRLREGVVGGFVGFCWVLLDPLCFGEVLAAFAFAVHGCYRVRPSRLREGVVGGFVGFYWIRCVLVRCWRRLRLPSTAAAASDPPACGRVLSGVSLGFFGSVVFGEALAAFAVPGRYRVRPPREREGVVGEFVEFFRTRFRTGLN